jgi:hypothetical protein
MTCTLCPSPAVEGDPLHLCRSHGGVPGDWAWAHGSPFEDAA